MAQPIHDADGPLVRDPAPSEVPGNPRLEDVLGDVFRIYPLPFSAYAYDYDAEREAIDREIFCGLVRP